MEKNQERNAQEAIDEKKSDFIATLSALPTALQKHFFAHILGSILIAILSIIAVITIQDLRLIIIMVVGLYIAYLGLDIVWSYSSGKLISHKMMCIKATKHQLLNCLDVIFQELDSAAAEQDQIHNFYIPNTKKNKVIFSEGTIFEIYYRPDNPTQITAWAVLGSSRYS